MNRFTTSVLLTTSLFFIPFALPALSQDQSAPPQQQSNERGQRRGGFGMGVGGTIQSISGDTITLTTRDGGTATVRVSSDTRLMRDGEAAKLSDFKAGDRVFVRGESTGENTWKAQMIGSGRMGAGGFGGGGDANSPMMQRMREGMGKEFIAGEVKSIDGTKLTVHGVDGKDYNIEVDENTSFRKGRESITFPDIKVGDRIMGRGKPNSAGVFVAETLNVGGFGAANGRGEARDSGAGDAIRPAPPKQ